MAAIERMTIVFPEPMAAMLRAAVDAGEYTTTSEVVRDAIRLWTDKRMQKEQDIMALRKAWNEGKASGSAGALNMSEIIDELESEVSYSL